MSAKAVIPNTPLSLKLQAYTAERRGFHLDRQLSDEVLIADGWKVERDEDFEGGVRWSRNCPGGLTLNSTERSRAHPMHDLNAAIAVIPWRHDWSLHRSGKVYTAKVHAPDGAVSSATADEPTIAVLIAALRVIAYAARSAGR